MARDFFSNQFLIAVPAMDDPHFARGVTLVCEHNEHGAMGLLVNRPSEYTLGEIFEQMQIDAAAPGVATETVVVGGPVLPDRGFVLHDGGDEWPSTLRVAPGLAVTTSREILAAMARGQGPSRSLVALGYASWGAGQLEQELADNAWLTAPADQAIVFELPFGQRWQAAARRVGVDLGQFPGYVGHA
ncbi:MAG: YqgE/AlgH family protein [Proteobacteria bacterium]|nr:YqgE/AlgH family protein [Pseudomonadota bacterium]